jgi:hypothetical protein
MKTRLTLLFLFLWIATLGAAAPVKMTPVKVTDGVYMLEHSAGSGNSTVVFTDEGVVVFDFHIDNADQTLAFRSSWGARNPMTPATRLTRRASR